MDKILLNRRGLCRMAAALVFAGVLAVPVHAQAPKTVLFVCQAGTVKSAIARELFRARATERRIDVRAISRGLKPEDHVSAVLKAHLATDRIDSTREPVQALDQAALDRADIVVLFDPLPANLVRPDARDWTATPSMNDSYDQARAFMIERIDALLDELRK